MAVEVTGPMHERYDEILSERALALVDQTDARHPVSAVVRFAEAL